MKLKLKIVLPSVLNNKGMFQSLSPSKMHTNKIINKLS